MGKEKVQLKGNLDVPADAPKVQLAGNELPSQAVQVVAADGTYGEVAGENLQAYLTANPGSQLASPDLIARKSAELEEARKEIADPYAYRERQYLKREKEMDAADAAIGIPGQIAGGLFALSPLGPAVGASLAGGMATPGGGGARNPLPGLARAQYGMLDPGGITSAGITAGAGLFDREEDTKAFLNQQRAAPGYAQGQAVGFVGGASLAGAPFAGASSHVARAAAMGLEGASGEATGAWLQNRETTAQKIIMAGMLAGAAELAPIAAGAAVEAAAKGVRRFGAFSEALSGDAQAAQELRNAVRAGGQDPVAYEQYIVNGMRTPEAIAQTRNNFQNMVARETQAIAEATRDKAAVEAWKEVSGVSVREVADEVSGLQRDLRADLELAVKRSPAWEREAAKIADPRVRAILEERTRKQFYEAWIKRNPGIDAELKGATKFLADASRIADSETGLITQEAMAELRAGLKTPRYGTVAERRGATAVAKRIEGRLVESLADWDPAKFGDLKAMQKQLDLHTTLWNITRDAVPPMAPAAGEAAKRAVSGLSLSTLLGYSSIFSGHLPAGIGLLGTKALAGEVFNAARRLVPNAIVGERMAHAILTVNSTVQDSARALAASMATSVGLGQKSAVKLPTREQYNEAVHRLYDMANRPADLGALRYIDEDLYTTALGTQKRVGENALKHVGDLPEAIAGVTGKGGQAGVPHGALGTLFGLASHKPKELQPSEILAWDYIQAVLNPLGAVKSFGTHRASSQTLLALEENYPDVLSQFQDELIKNLSESAGKHGGILPLEHRAYLARVLGRPVDVTTDPAFAVALHPTKSVPPQPSPSPAVQASREQPNPNLMTQAERNESHS